MAERTVSSRRADAERNRERILEVARQAFDEATEPSMAEIARRAGVGMATLYRHFPGRPDLLAELYHAQIEAMCEAAAHATGETPGARFLDWLATFHAAGAGKAPLVSLLVDESQDGTALVTGSRARVIRAGEPLLLAAQDSGEIRSDVVVRQVLDAVASLGQLGRYPAAMTSVIDVFRDGLRARPEAARRRPAGGAQG